MKNTDLKKRKLEHPEKIRMVVCDLDGTLLFHAGRLSAKARQVIRLLREKGILFGICSGRPIGGLKNTLPVWQIEHDVDFVLGFNGGSIWHPSTSETEEWMKLPAEIIKPIMKTFDGYGVTFAEYHGDEILVNRDGALCRQMAKRNHLRLRVVSEAELCRPTLKLMAVGMPWTISRYLKNHTSDPSSGWRFFRSGPFLIEIISPQLSKLEGVLRIADEYGIKPDEILSFGNDNNDLEMLEGTIGVAVDNALDPVKEKAAYICESNHQDGVALFLDENLLSGQNE